MTDAREHRGAIAAIIGLLGLLVALAPLAADAEAAKKRKPNITVMTRNAYLGADLGPAIEADNTCDAIDAAGDIINEVDATDFRQRAVLLANEIGKAKPDLLGLQEMALWRDTENADFTATPSTHVRYDFLKILRNELRKQGVAYRKVVVQNEFDQELPADIDGDDATQDDSFPFCGADIDGRLTMRDAILVRKGGRVKTGATDMAHFSDENSYQVVLGGVLPITVKRGWVSTEAKIPGSKRTKRANFRFVNTHLEAFGDPDIRERQARELFAKGGPLRTRKQLIFLGDINSGGKRDRVGAPFTDPGDRGAYKALVGDFNMTNLGTRQTCCFSDVIAASISGEKLDHTVDHIMTKPRLKQKRSKVTGSDPTVAKGGLISSDHGGLWSRLKLK